MVAMVEGGRWEDREWAQGLGVGGVLNWILVMAAQY